MASISRNMGAGNWAMLTALSVLWGGSFFFVEVALRELPPFTLVLLRVALGAAVPYAILALLGPRMPRDRAAWSAFAAMASLNNALPFSLLTWGQTQIAGGLASILNATTPLWTVIVAHALTADERATGGKLVGLAFGFAGVVLMIGLDALEGFGADVLAQMACLAAALSYAFASVFGRRFRAMGVPPLAAATGQLTASAVLLLPVALMVEAPWRLAFPGAETWSAMAGLVLLSTAAAYILYFRLLASAGATNLILVTFLIPVTAMLLGSLLLDERLEGKHLAGMAMIAAGLVWIDGRLPGRAFNRTRRIEPAHYQGRDI